jgi:transposase InsO family protein
VVRSLRAQPLGRDGRLPQTLALAPTLRHPQPLVAPQPLHPLAFDCQFEQTAEDRALKLLNIVDEFTRESLVMLVERSIDADTVVAVLERLVAEPGAPELFRGDNGPGMTAHALRDWCVLSRTATAFIEPGSPWQDPSWPLSRSGHGARTGRRSPAGPEDGHLSGVDAVAQDLRMVANIGLI